MKTTGDVCLHLATLVAFAAAAGCDDAAPDPAAAFVGTWHYDLPDRASNLNIGRVTCPGLPPLVVPQIGSIVLTSSGDGQLTGRTDQGCTWTFAVDGTTARLDPPGQTCFNEVIQSSYTLDWTIELDGDRASEVITGASHMEGGDCAFTLEVASRTRVLPDPSVDPSDAFTGTWEYDAPDPQTGANVQQLTCGGPPSYVPLLGGLVVAKSGEGQIRATSATGCTWTFDVQGNTAQLSPAEQWCPDPADGPHAMSFWAFASDGQRAATFSSGLLRVDGESCHLLSTAGSLTRR